jgi:hypothetical protein
MSRHSRGVDVDLNGLRTFVDQLEASTEQGLKPGIARAENEIQNGAGIGRAFPGGQVAAARQMLIQAMARARDNTSRHIQAAEILTTAVKRALENYARSDQDTAGRLAQIEDVVTQAVAAAQRVAPPQPSTPAGPQP